MKEETILSRRFKAKLPSGGRIVVDAKLTKLGDQDPYFSVTTSHGVASEEILKEIPDLAPVLKMHLANEDGEPMHAAANALYHVRNKDVEALSRHLRISKEEAEKLIRDTETYANSCVYTPNEKAEKEFIDKYVNAMREKWREEAKAAKSLLRGDTWHSPGYFDESPDQPIPYAKLPDGDTVKPLDILHSGFLPEIDFGEECYAVAQTSEDAGHAARLYWQDMIKHSPGEFTAIVGEDSLVKWALGQPAGPGNVKVTSVDEWLDLTAKHPEETFAGYDGKETEIQINKALADELSFRFKDEGDGWMKLIAFRTS